jgi:hypothetical protein
MAYFIGSVVLTASALSVTLFAPTGFPIGLCGFSAAIDGDMVNTTRRVTLTDLVTGVEGYVMSCGPNWSGAPPPVPVRWPQTYKGNLLVFSGSSPILAQVDGLGPSARLTIGSWGQSV